MSPVDITLLISSVTVAITTIIGAIFAGFIALHQNPMQSQNQQSMHNTVNKIAEQNGVDSKSIDEVPLK